MECRVSVSSGPLHLTGRVEPAPFNTRFFIGTVSLGDEELFGVQADLTPKEDSRPATGFDFLLGSACCASFTSAASLCTVCKKPVPHAVSDSWSSPEKFQALAETCLDAAGVNPLDACLLSAWLIDAVRSATRDA